MKRRSSASDKPARSRRPKSSKSRSRTSSKPAGTRPSQRRAETEVAELKRDLRKSVEQQAATAASRRASSPSRASGVRWRPTTSSPRRAQTDAREPRPRSRRCTGLMTALPPKATECCDAKNDGLCQIAPMALWQMLIHSDSTLRP